LQLSRSNDVICVIWRWTKSTSRACSLGAEDVRHLHDWLCPFYARLQQHPAFRHFAPSHQFDQLVQSIAAEHPAKAGQMREWSAGAQHGLLLHLASMITQNEGAEPVELWRVKKAERELQCVAHYLPIGIDLRLMEGEDFRRTQLVKDTAGGQGRAW
jgi:hypothetical protein